MLDATILARSERGLRNALGTPPEKPRDGAMLATKPKE
jgi:hypothetical protein